MKSKQEKLISSKLKSDGFFVIKNFLKKNDVDKKFLTYLKKKKNLLMV